MIKKEGRGTEGRNKVGVNERVTAITKNCASTVTAGARSGVSLQHGFDLLGGSLIVQMFCCVPESIEKTFYTIRRLVLKNFDTTFHINF